ncbi:MAG: T9SS type B sorting domain-containing protein [Bacteroidetes bacterium]|nr:T9SS type B sorting domain-containing protein [Bacteroidota bacterium]
MRKILYFILIFFFSGLGNAGANNTLDRLASIMPLSVTGITYMDTCDLNMGAIDITVSNGTPPYTYAWSNGATMEDLSNLMSGMYTVTVTDAVGSTQVASYIVGNITNGIPIYVHYFHTVHFTPNTMCTAPYNGSVYFDSISTALPFIWNWTNGATTSYNTGLAGGYYNLTVTLGTCVMPYGPNSFHILDDLNIPDITGTATNASCGLSNGSIDQTIADGTPPFSFAWNNGAGTEDLDGLPPGIYNVTVTDAGGCTSTASYSISDVIPYTLSATATPASSCTTDNGGIDLSVDPPGGGYTYTWSNGAMTEDLSDVPAGTYTVTVGDGNGCSVTATFIVEDTAIPPTATASPAAAACGLGNGGVDLTASGGTPPYTYAWDNGAVTEDLANVPAGTYTVTVTGANGCTATATATVADSDINIALGGTAMPNTACTGANGSVTTTVSPASPPTGSYTYAWNNGANTPGLSPVPGGTYALTVTVGTCTSSASFTVPDQPEALVLGAQPSPATCGGSDGGVDLTVLAGQPPLAFVWDNGAGTEDLAGVPAGIYTVTVTATGTGCTATATAFVGSDTIAIGVPGDVTDNTSCTSANGSIDISPVPVVPPLGGYTYAWSSGATTEDISALSAGTYTVTVGIGTGCSATASFTVGSGPQLPGITLNATPAGCGGPGSVDLTATGGTPPYSYLWSNTATTEDLGSVPAGMYTVTVTGTDGCSATASVTVPNSGSGADTTAVYTTTCDPNGVGISEQLFTNQQGCDSLVITTVTLLQSDTTYLSGTSCNPNNVGTFEQTYANQNGCDSLVVTTVTLLQSDTTYLSGTSCNPANVGTFEQTLTNQDGCDSLVVTTVTFAAADTTAIALASCNPNDVGTFEQTLTNQYGCDSLVITTVTLLQSDTTQLFGTSCNPANVGTFEQTLTNQFGCDSLVVTTIAFSAADTTAITSTSCNPNDVGTFEQTLTNQGGCDSVVITTITLLQSDTTYLSGTSCNPANVGTFEQTLANQFGCDSLVVTTIAFSEADTTAIAGTSCDINDVGTFEQSYTNQYGCDSVVITTVTLLQGDTVQLFGTSCNPSDVGVTVQNLTNQLGCDSLVFTTITFAEADTTAIVGTTCDPSGVGVTEQLFTNANGCDSLVITTVTLLPSATTSLASTTCDPSQAGVFTENLTTWQGCDSTVTTTVTLLPSETTSLITTTCDPMQAGVFTENLLTWLGCDSIVTTTVTLLPSAMTSLSTTTCDPSQAGVFFQNLTTWQGCDSTVTTTLAWTPPPALTVTASDFNGYGTSCEGASDGWVQASANGSPPLSYGWDNGSILPLLEGLSPGSYAVTVTDANGCASVGSVALLGPGELSLGLSVTALACFDNSSGGVTASATGGVPPYSYSLNPTGTGVGAPQPSGTFGGLGAGTYEITVQDANGCSATELVAINAPVPLSVELGEDVFLELGDGTALSALTNVPLDSLAQVDWTGIGNVECPGCPDQQVFPLVTTAYTVTVVDGQGCVASDGVTVYVDRRKSVYVPNAFSPNGDGINDLLQVFAREGQVRKVKSFLVFDRWGESVFRYFDFQPNDPAFGWDGTHRGQPLNTAVFAWFAEVEFVDGTAELFEGDVVLMR